MSSVQLQANEAMVLKADSVHYGTGSVSFTSELVLTNLQIYVTLKGFFGKTKGVFSFPINQIKTYNGQAQVLQSKSKSGYFQVDVYYVNRQETFVFQTKSEANRWVECIQNLVLGIPIDLKTTNSKAIPGTEVIAETLKDTFDTIKGVFGGKPKAETPKTPVKVSKQCSGCGSPLSGIQGQVIVCQYCDTKQII